MTDKEWHDEFDSALAALSELKNKEMSVAFARLYKKALLSRLTIQQAVQAITMAFSTKTYGFPQPADLIEMILGEESDNSVITAWGDLQNAVQITGRNGSVLFTDPKITKVIELMGGWIEVCNWQIEDIKFRRQEFIKLYKGIRDPGEQRVLPGLDEINNSSRGYLEFVPKPTIVGDGSVQQSLPKTKRQLFVEHCVNTTLADPLNPVDEKEEK